MFLKLAKNNNYFFVIKAILIIVNKFSYFNAFYL